MSYQPQIIDLDQKFWFPRAHSLKPTANLLVKSRFLYTSIEPFIALSALMGIRHPTLSPTPPYNYKNRSTLLMTSTNRVTKDTAYKREKYQQFKDEKLLTLIGQKKDKVALG